MISGQVQAAFKAAQYSVGVLALVLAFGPQQAEAQAGGLFAPPKKVEAPIAPSGTATTTTEIVDGQNQMAILQSNGAQLLQDDMAKYSSIVSNGGFPTVSGGNFKKGDKGASVGVLNKRLFIEGYLRVEGTQGQFANVYTSATVDAVGRFQRNHGLAITGKVDATTVAELNVPADKRLATIAANIPRLATYEQSLGDRYVVVNIPAQQLEAISNGRVFERHNVIVGRPARPSPVVMTPLATVKFNPYWNAPVSIVEKDILPKLQNSLQYLKDINMKILEGGPNGPEVDPKTLNFRALVPDNYLFREEPGPANAMATAKIEFSSPFGIYLHDTPDKPMFNYNNRFFSSGCIRVQNMPQLVNWVLNGQDGYNTDKIGMMAKTLERLDVQLTAPPQLRVAYLTAWPAPGGTVAFRNDIYQMDGSGFVMGQPMPVGEMSPDGKRFVLKPLPRQLPIDEAEGAGFLGFHGASKQPSLFSSGSRPLFTSQGSQFGGKPLVVADQNNKSKGPFNWAAYNKRQAADAKKVKKPLKVAKADKLAKAGAVKAKPAKAIKKVKKLDCKAGADGTMPNGCKPAAAVDAAAATKTP